MNFARYKSCDMYKYCPCCGKGLTSFVLCRVVIRVCDVYTRGRYTIERQRAFCNDLCWLKYNSELLEAQEVFDSDSFSRYCSIFRKTIEMQMFEHVRVEIGSNGVVRVVGNDRVLYETQGNYVTVDTRVDPKPAIPSGEVVKSTIKVNMKTLEVILEPITEVAVEDVV